MAERAIEELVAGLAAKLEREEMTPPAMLEGKKVLMVLAHCDDEVVCGWPVLQNPAITKSLLIVSSDRYSSQRQWCSHRKFATQDICRTLGVDVRVMDYDSEFYRLDHRSGKLAKAEEEILKTIDKFKFDFIFTHNPHGEYGHLDHKFLSNLLLRAAESPLVITDISLIADWTRIEPTSRHYLTTFYRNLIGSVALNQAFYDRIKDFYTARGVWTWSIKPSTTANLYLI
jgi:LmbE family N-acetylglucosaminyl deacetylase